MRQIPRLREMLDEADGPELHAILAEMKVVHPRKERLPTKVPPPKRAGRPGPDSNTEVIYLRDVDVDRYLTSGSYYGIAHHVARWLHAYGYRAGMGIKAAGLALDAYTLDCGVPSPGIEIGQVAYDPKTGKDRRLLRRAERGIFAGFEIWAVQDCVAHAGSPVPWDTDRIFPWVVHVDTLVPCREDGRPIKVTFSMPAGGPPGSPEWEVAELAAVKRAGIHEAMESFGFDPHTLGDVAEDERMRELAEVRSELEAAIGRIPDTARATVQLAREVAGIAEHRRIDADHYRSEAAKVGELEGALAEMVNREIEVRDVGAVLGALAHRRELDDHGVARAVAVDPDARIRLLAACHAERAREEARVGLTVRADELRPGELAYHADDRAGLPWLARVGDTWWWLSGEDDVDLAEVHAAAASPLDGEACDFRVLVRREGLKTWAEVRDALREEVTREATGDEEDDGDA